MKKGLSLLIAVLLLMTALPTVLADAPEGAPTITIYNNSGIQTGSVTGTGSSERAYELVQQAIYESSGIWVEGIFAPPTEAGTQLNLLLSGGEDIDLWWGSWTEYYDTGLIRTWNDLVTEEVFQKAYQGWDEWNAWPGVTDAEGNIWGMPRDVPITPYKLFFRQDWLDQLGYKMPSTIDEVNDYLYAVKEADPYGNGTTIPLITGSLGDLEQCFLAGYVKGGNGMWLDEDGSLKPKYLAEGYTDFLQQMITWYKDGIIPKEAFSWDTNTIRDYISKNQAAVTAYWYSSITGRSDQSTENYIDMYGSFDFDKYTYVYMSNLDGITGPNGNYIDTSTKPSASCVMMNANCDNPDACIQYLGWGFNDFKNYQLASAGIEGLMWRFDPNDPDAETNHTICGWSDENGTPMYMHENGELTYDNDGELDYRAEFNAFLGLPFETLVTVYDPWGRQGMHNLWLQKNLNNFDKATPMGDEANVIFDTTALENACMYSDINSYAGENRLKFLIGERDMSEWDSFIQELYDLGLQDYIDEHTRQYNEAMGK